MKRMRCLAELTISTRFERLDLWPGVEVDFDRELDVNHTIADAVAGRETCFEPVEVPAVGSVTDAVDDGA